MRAKIGTLLAAIAAAIGTLGAATWARRRQAADELDLEVTEPAAPATGPAGGDLPPSAAAASADDADTGAAAPVVDDLTAIKGLGKVKVAKLAEIGITSYAQIAAWTEEDIAEVGLKVNTSPGQIKREDWVGQAKALAEG
jgi:predicted flap endonuclease-1-like 5' DNA nuclease